MIRSILTKTETYQGVAAKFKPQLETLLKEKDLDKLKERVSKAINFFSKGLVDDVLNPLDAHKESLKGIKKIKKYLQYVKTVRSTIVKKILTIENASLGDISFNPSHDRIAIEGDAQLPKQKKGKIEKGSSLNETLTLIRQEHSVSDIARKRELAISTIEGHVAMLVKTGEVNILQVIDEAKLNKIVAAIGNKSASSLTVVKAKLGDEYSFGEIRAVMNHLDFLNREGSA
jgi:uncharacterized protein YpbB